MRLGWAAARCVASVVLGAGETGKEDTHIVVLGHVGSRGVVEGVVVQKGGQRWPVVDGGGRGIWCGAATEEEEEDNADERDERDDAARDASGYPFTWLCVPRHG